MQRVQATTQRLFSRGRVLGEGDLEDLAPLPRLRHFAREFVVIGKIGQFFRWGKRRASERGGGEEEQMRTISRWRVLGQKSHMSVVTEACDVFIFITNLKLKRTINV